MKTWLYGVLTTGFFAGPIVAVAQVTTLDYQGATMTGEVLTYVDATLTTTNAYTGAFSATVVLDGSISADDLSVVSYSVNGPVAISGGFQPSSPGSVSWLLGPGELTINESQGVITGATFNYYESPGNGAGDASFNITPSGDSFQVGAFSPGVGSGTETIGSGPPGIWTVTAAPEIDCTSISSGLALLFGGLLVLRGRPQVIRLDAT